jgi:uncharacterized protein (DUF2147 family)
MNIKIVLCCSIFLFAAICVKAQDKFCKVWYTQEGASKVQIYLGDDGKYYGKIVWLRDGIVNGKPLIDNKNPDESKRTQPWLGLQIIAGLSKKSETEIVNGKIYDPTKGNYYSCKMTIVDGKLELRGYILGMPFLGRTTTWHLAEENRPINIPTTPQPSNTKPTTQPQ